jgi:hypothetical protein
VQISAGNQIYFNSIFQYFLSTELLNLFIVALVGTNNFGYSQTTFLNFFSIFNKYWIAHLTRHFAEPLSTVCYRFALIQWQTLQIHFYLDLFIGLNKSW